MTRLSYRIGWNVVFTMDGLETLAGGLGVGTKVVGGHNNVQSTQCNFGGATVGKEPDSLRFSSFVNSWTLTLGTFSSLLLPIHSDSSIGSRGSVRNPKKVRAHVEIL